jgi:endoglycosylceramidase
VAALYANVPVRPGDPPAIVRDQSLPASGDNVDEARLGALDAPHPRVVAGTPTGWSLDAVTGVFTAEWSTTLPSGRPAGEEAVSEVWLGRRRYSGGYHLTLTGARIVTRTADRIVVRALPGAAQVSVVATPVPPPAS